MSIKTQLIILGAVSLVAFASGRYTAKAPDVAEAIKAVTQDNTHQDVHTTKVIVQTPDGTVKTTETTDTQTQTVEKIATQESEKITSPKSTLNISALVAEDFSKGTLTPIYGVSVSKEFSGPVTVGLFGLTNGTLGVSLGINF